jgi:hypothetical protein
VASAIPHRLYCRAVVLVLLGVIAVAVRLDGPSDGTAVSFYWADGVVVEVPSPVDVPGLHTGDVVIEIAGHRLADGLGGLARPQLGRRSGTTSCATAPHR